MAANWVLLAGGDFHKMLHFTTVHVSPLLLFYGLNSDAEKHHSHIPNTDTDSGDYYRPV